MKAVRYTSVLALILLGSCVQTHLPATEMASEPTTKSPTESPFVNAQRLEITRISGKVFQVRWPAVANTAQYMVYIDGKWVQSGSAEAGYELNLTPYQGESHLLSYLPLNAQGQPLSLLQQGLFLPEALLKLTETQPQSEKTTRVQGRIFDTRHSPLRQAQVKISGRDLTPAFEAQTQTDAQGSYLFVSVPVGQKLHISVTYPEYSKREREEVVRFNPQNRWEINRFDFGNDGQSSVLSPDHEALSDAPEITHLLVPGTEGQAPNELGLSFSEPVEASSLEKQLYLRALDTVPLSVTPQDLFFVWNETGDRVQIHFKHLPYLPTHREKGQIPSYELRLENRAGKAGALLEKAGKADNLKPFRLSSEPAQAKIVFSPEPDIQAPQLLRLGHSKRGSQTIIALHFNKVLWGPERFFPWPPDQPLLNLTSVMNPNLYQLHIWSSQGALRFLGSLASLGGTIHFGETAPIGLTAELRTALFETLLEKGSKLQVSLDLTFTDPAGNPINPEQRSAQITIP